jgi:hypothetical protein
VVTATRAMHPNALTRSEEWGRPSSRSRRIALRRGDAIGAGSLLVQRVTSA